MLKKILLNGVLFLSLINAKAQTTNCLSKIVGYTNTAGTSTKWAKQSQTDNLFDTKYNLAQEKSQYFNTSNGSLLSSNYKTTYEYNANNELTITLDESFENDKLKHGSRFLNKYDAAGNIIEIQRANVDSLGKIYTYYTLTKTFDSNKNVVNETLEEFDQVSFELISKYRIDFEYDSNNKKIKEIIKNWNYVNKDWKPTDTVLFKNTYNKNNKLLSSKNLTTTDEFLYEYDSLGNVTYDARRTYDKLYKYYKYDYATTYKYDTNGNVILKTNQFWSDVSWKLVNTNQYSYEYDALSRLINETSYNWSIYNESFYQNDRWLYQYDKSGKLKVKTRQDMVSNWTDRYKEEYTYSCPLVSGIEDEEINEQISIYPNPASTEIHLTGNAENKSIKLFNNFGNEVLNGDFQNNKLNIESLSSGIYLYQILNNDKISKSGKLLITD